MRASLCPVCVRDRQGTRQDPNRMQLLFSHLKKKARARAGAMLGWLALSTASLFAAPPTISIPRIETPPTLGDFEDMKPSSRVADHMLKITGFIVREPA